MIGTVVGSYRISSKLSAGGMGTVYAAEHVLIGKPAAVKILHPELSANQEIVNRFFLEAKATTSIKHPGIVDIFDFGYMASGHAYLVMEFLEGMSMAQRLRSPGGGKMLEGEAAILLRGICNALAAAHGAGIVHRDLKPDNIFLVPDPEAPLGIRPKILDFGIAKLTDIGLAGTGTKTGAVMGTPTYMSPEQCSGNGQVDHRADLYSVGCILYELVTGRPPFTDLGAGELIGAHLYIAPVPPTKWQPQLSADTTMLIMALLAKNPAKRPQTAKELSQRLLLIAHQSGLTTGTASRLSEPALPMLPPLQVEAIEGMAPTEDLGVLLPPLPSSVMSDPILMTTVDTPIHDQPDQPRHPVNKPTTLSSAASSLIEYRPKSRKGLVVAGAAVAAVVIALVFTFGGRALEETRPAVQPVAAPLTPPAPIEPPTPTETAAPTPPTPTDPPPVETVTPTATPPVLDSPPPVVTKQSRKPVLKKPVLKKPGKQPVEKPIKKPGNVLIETDLD